MKKYSLLIILFFLYFANTISQTVVPGGNVSGLWIKDKSPYQIEGDILIAGDSVLKIEPGVVVEFQGHYKLKIQGQLLAQGALGDSVTFTIKDTTGLSVDSIPDGGWGGIRFEDNNSTDSSRIEYCKVQYGKVMFPDSCGGGIFVKDFSKLVIANSNISYNRIYGGKVKENFTNLYGGGIACFNSSPNIRKNFIGCNQIYSSSYLLNDGIDIYIIVSLIYGGGIANYRSNANITDNVIIANKIHGIPFWHTEMQYYGIDGFGNTGGGGSGIALLNKSNCTIKRNIINNNIGSGWIAINGGGVLCDSSYFHFKDNTLEYNIANNGGGVCIINNSIVTIDNNIIKFNTAKGIPDKYGINFSCRGGGIAIYNSKADIINDTISNNNVFGIDADYHQGNAIGGGIYLQESDCIISDNKISNNYMKGGIDTEDIGYCGGSYGGGIYSDGESDFIINHNLITKNIAKARCGTCSAAGGGIFINKRYNTKKFRERRIINNIINDNAIPYSEMVLKGGGLYIEDSVLVYNNVITNNSLFSEFYARGAGIYCIKNNRIINNTIYNNDNNEDCAFPWNYEGRGIYCEDTTNIIINNIIWGKGKCLTLIHSGKVSFCDVQDTIKGVGNISQDPKFDNTSTNPYSLLWNSPCIDKGSLDTTGLFLPKYDIAGNPRVVNGRVDIGAYEYQGGVGIDELGPSTSLRMTKLRIKTYPNPFTQQTIISYQLPEDGIVNLKIFDIIGNEVLAPVTNERQLSGKHEVIFDAMGLKEGMYFYRIKAGDKEGMGKIILMR